MTRKKHVRAPDRRTLLSHLDRHAGCSVREVADAFDISEGSARLHLGFLGAAVRLGVDGVYRVAQPCDHDFQWHPMSEDVGACSRCGQEAVTDGDETNA